MFDNPEKLFILFVIALMIFGPSKLASLGASLGRSIRDFRSAVRGAHDEFRTAVQEHVDSLAPALPAPDPLSGETAMPVVDYGSAMGTPVMPADSASVADSASAYSPGADAGGPAAGIDVIKAGATGAAPAHGADPGGAAASSLTEDDPASLASEPTAAALRESLSR